MLILRSNILKLPALFLGITGIDEEFRNRDEFANPMLYNTRLNQLADALGEVMSDFGGGTAVVQDAYVDALLAAGALAVAAAVICAILAFVRLRQGHGWVDALVSAVILSNTDPQS